MTEKKTYNLSQEEVKKLIEVLLVDEQRLLSTHTDSPFEQERLSEEIALVDNLLRYLSYSI